MLSLSSSCDTSPSSVLVEDGIAPPKGEKYGVDKVHEHPDAEQFTVAGCLCARMSS